MAKKVNGKAGAAAPQKSISKMEAVRRALVELGSDAKSSAIQGLIKDRFGIDITPNHISACKGKIQSTQPTRASPAATTPAAKESTASPSPAAAQPASAPTQAPARKPVAKKSPAPRTHGKPAVARPETLRKAAGAGGISLPDIEAVKGLVRRVGAEQLRSLVDLLTQ